jgi:hypothetical protein
LLRAGFVKGARKKDGQRCCSVHAHVSKIHCGDAASATLCCATGRM